MLTNENFGQREIAKYLKIKFGGSVNAFVQWLIDLGYVSQTGPSKRGGKRYQVVSPVGLISFYSKFRKMELLDTFTFAMSRDETIEYLGKIGVIFCLTTALSQYNKFFSDSAIYAYIPEDKKYFLEDEVKYLAKGKTLVNIYKYDLDDDTVEINNKKITSKVRTVIDLYCDNKAHAAEEFVRELW